tara:strand:- start:74 stop:205 length:132 start_codon:yes stop_codon:yes gene_type:complete
MKSRLEESVHDEQEDALRRSHDVDLGGRYITIEVAMSSKQLTA